MRVQIDTAPSHHALRQVGGLLCRPSSGSPTPWWWGYTETVSPCPPRLHRISTFQRHAEVSARCLFLPTADIGCRAFMSTRPSVMGPMRSSPPCDRHAAELTLLSVVDAEAATLCC